MIADNFDFTEGWSFPDMSRFPSGLDGEQMHAVFGLRYQHAIWQQFRERDRATYGLARSSGALAAPIRLFCTTSTIIASLCEGSSMLDFGLLWCPEVRDG